MPRVIKVKGGFKYEGYPRIFSTKAEAQKHGQKIKGKKKSKKK